MKTQLTLAQSDYLIARGMDPELASVHGLDYTNSAGLKVQQRYFTLDDLCTLIPSTLPHRDSQTTMELRMTKRVNYWEVSYCTPTRVWTIQTETELIDALYRTFAWGLETCRATFLHRLRT